MTACSQPGCRDGWVWVDIDDDEHIKHRCSACQFRSGDTLLDALVDRHKAKRPDASSSESYMYAAVWLAMYVCDHFPDVATHLTDRIRAETR